MLKTLVLVALVLLSSQIVIRNVNDPDNIQFASSNPIAAARLASGDTALPNGAWAGAGVTGGIPTRTTICSTLTSSATMAQINSAIDGCGSGQVVFLSAGTYSVSGCIDMESNVTLRGAGPQTGGTIINFTSNGSCGTYWGGGAGAVNFQTGGSFDEAVPPATTGVPAGTVRTWTGCAGVSGSYPQGCTVLDYTGTSYVGPLTAGMTLTIWQNDTADGSVPTTGYWVSDKCHTLVNDVSWKCSNFSGFQGVSLTQRSRVVSVSATQVTISPGLTRPAGSWQTGRTPKMGYQTGIITGAGLEYMRLNPTGSIGTGKVVMNVAQESWLLGVTLCGSTDANAITMWDTRNITIKDSWICSLGGGGGGQTTSYGYQPIGCTGCLIVNTILENQQSAFMTQNGTANVAAYNYEIGTNSNGFDQHETASEMNLYEGNDADRFFLNTIHGVQMLETIFRNTTHGGGASIDVWAYDRYYNIVGNVLDGNVVYKASSTAAPYYTRFGSANSGGACIRLGYTNQNDVPEQLTGTDPIDGGTLQSKIFHDPTTTTSAMLWGNYCVAGASTRFVSGEVPSTDPTYPNPVPGSQVLPNSLMYAARPPYFVLASPISVTVTWPPIGPDVTGGNITGFGGHAYKIPARVMYEFTGANVANFNPSLYGQ